MRYLSEDQVTQMMGIGYLGEVRQGPDGNLYQYVQGVDGLGNPIGGIWSRVKRWTRSAVRKALPIAQKFAPFIPGGAAALTAATPFLKQAGVAGYEGWALYTRHPTAPCTSRSRDWMKTRNCVVWQKMKNSEAWTKMRS